MENQLLKKLQIKSGFKISVLNAPANAEAIFDPIPNDVSFSLNKEAQFDAVLIFAQTKADMLSALNHCAKQIDTKTICWILYPKSKSGLATDLNLMQSWDDLKTFGLAPCASAAVNNTWAALKIKPEAATKRSGVGNEEIVNNAYGEYIDVQHKIITLPADLKAVLEKNSKALAFYEQLSYSNRKEYVLWVLTAKQEKTRFERIQKTLEKLEAGLKNPSAKA